MSPRLIIHNIINRPSRYLVNCSYIRACFAICSELAYLFHVLLGKFGVPTRFPFRGWLSVFAEHRVVITFWRSFWMCIMTILGASRKSLRMKTSAILISCGLQTMRRSMFLIFDRENILKICDSIVSLTAINMINFVSVWTKVALRSWPFHFNMFPTNKQSAFAKEV
jgi:hypothetical protein